MQPLALYVHIPFCSSKCHYCAFSVVTNNEHQEHYIDALLSEWRSKQPLLEKYTIDTIYIGGGTPSLLRRDLLAKLLQHLPQAREISMECNPEQVTPDFLEHLQHIGVQRVSMGVQTFEDSILKKMNRQHTAFQAKRALETLQSSPLSWNADIILGLPGITKEQSIKDLQTILHHKPHHVSAYFLSVEPGTVLSSMTLPLPQEQELLDTYRRYQAILQQADYQQVELSNWAQPDHACQHNLHYWQGDPYLGIGLGASSLLDNTTWTNTRNLNLYLQHQWTSEVPVGLDARETLFHLITSASRLIEGLPWKRIAAQASEEEQLILMKNIEQLKQQKLLRQDYEGIALETHALPLHESIVQFLWRNL